ncbi:MAG: hypothetical protein FH761_17980 [Firmicutes bacterium]|nr:hypothetical protein [Bacillota bacterium]
MTEEKKEYILSDGKTGLNFTAKRFIDLANDIKKLNDTQKELLISKIDVLDSFSLVEVFNFINEYIDLETTKGRKI